MKKYLGKVFKVLVFILIFLSFATPQVAAKEQFTLIKGMGVIYLGLTNPVEAITSASKGGMVEQQHYVPQSFNTNFRDVVLITRINHTVSDRWKNRPFLNKHDNILINALTIFNDDSLASLNAAYRLGAYVSPYAIFRYGYYSSKTSLLCTQLDAPSMLVYGFAWLINTPQKLVNKIAYIIDMNTEPSIICILDIIPNILTFICFEIPLAVVGTTVGTIIAFIFNPFDSICSFLGMFYFLVMSVITACWDLFIGIIRLLPFV